MAEPSDKLSLPRVALAVVLLSNASTKILVEGLPGNLPESECSAALCAIPAVVSVAFVPEATEASEREPSVTPDDVNININVNTANHNQAQAQQQQLAVTDSVSVGEEPVPSENGKQERKGMRGVGSGVVSTGVPRSAVVEVATAAAVQPLVSHLEMIQMGGCELRAQLLLEPSEAEAAVQSLIDEHEEHLRNVNACGGDGVVATGVAATTAEDSVNPAAVATGVLRLVKALRCEEMEGQREGIMHDVRCVAARYGDVVDVDFSVVEGTVLDSKNAPDTDAAVDACMEGSEAGGSNNVKEGKHSDIVVKYKGCQGAERAAEALQGRMFAERPLVTVVESF